MLVPSTPLPEATKCALVSIDSTLKSNLSVGLPIDLVVYKADALRSDDMVCIDQSNPYFGLIRDAWGEGLRQAFDGIENPGWDQAEAGHPLRVRAGRYDALEKIHGPAGKIT